MLYTGSGDKGDMGIFGCDQRISKSSAVAEALGSLDEINSFLGLCKVKAKESDLIFPQKEKTFESFIHNLQEGLFLAQAELAGADKQVDKEKILQMEKMIEVVEKGLPSITSFFVAGGTELASLFDFARTIARRAERRLVEVKEEGKREIHEDTLTFLNRLSSVLYALARWVNYQSGVKEEKPEY